MSSLSDVAADIAEFELLQKDLVDSKRYLGTSTISLLHVIAWDHMGSEDRAITKLSSTTVVETPVEIELCFVAEISTSDFWMDANGGYTGKPFADGTVPSLSKVKGSFIICEPRMEPWKGDFHHVIKGFRWLGGCSH
ncbi:hypothetical protein JB92DRAFT_3127621 [Gautieria morchelliformis]|nr:hypothetical protein JB92DRAFT_3127621 [Gautieria morchelliformis]